MEQRMLNYQVHCPYALDLSRVDHPAELVLEYRLTIAGEGVEELCISSTFAASVKEALEHLRSEVAAHYPTHEKVEIHVLRITKVDASARRLHASLLAKMV